MRLGKAFVTIVQKHAKGFQASKSMTYQSHDEDKSVIRYSMPA